MPVSAQVLQDFFFTCKSLVSKAENHTPGGVGFVFVFFFMSLAAFLKEIKKKRNNTSIC